jgi:ribonuclease BN (tRNA processing enzyme)
VTLTIQFVGSGDAFGSGGRFQACISVRWAQAHVLLDCGASSLIALKRLGNESSTIDVVLGSHLHGDHFAVTPQPDGLAHNFQFHEVIHARCPNVYIRTQTRAAAERVHQSRVLYFGFPGRGAAATDEHDRLIEMLERGDDEEAIEQVAREHELETAMMAQNRRIVGGRSGGRTSSV